MAMVNKPTASLTFTWIDASGSKASTSFNVPFATTTAVALAAADVLRPLLRGVSNAEIIGQSLTYDYAESDAWAPDAYSRVEEKGFSSWRTANARSTSFTIPAIWDAILEADGTVNRLHPNWALLQAAIVATDAIFCGPDGSDIQSLISAYQRFNSSSKNQLPRGR